MTRIKGGVTRRRRHKKILGMTKGHQGVRHRLYRRAHESMIHAGQYAYDHRKQKKGDMRRLWITRINAAARECGMSYSEFISGLSKASVSVDRKILADIAVRDSGTFANLVNIAKEGTTVGSV